MIAGSVLSRPGEVREVNKSGSADAQHILERFGGSLDQILERSGRSSPAGLPSPAGWTAPSSRLERPSKAGEPVQY